VQLEIINSLKHSERVMPKFKSYNKLIYAIHTQTHTCTHAHTHKRMHVRTHAYTHRHMHRHMSLHTQIYTYIDKRITSIYTLSLPHLHKVTCRETYYKKTYIGETGRRQSHRINEHCHDINSRTYQHIATTFVTEADQ